MAKKKQATASNNGGAASTGSKKTVKAKAASASSASKAGSSKAPAKSAAPKSSASSQAPSTQLIGEVAGQVWQALSDNGPQSVAGLKKAVGSTDELVIAAIGWLAREDKLEFETSGKSTTVSLR